MQLSLSTDEARILELTLRRWGRRPIVITLTREDRVASHGGFYTDADVKAVQERLVARCATTRRVRETTTLS